MKLKSWVSNDLGNFPKKILFFNHKSINSNLIFPFFANGLHQNYLLKLGYLGYEKNEN